MADSPSWSERVPAGALPGFRFPLQLRNFQMKDRISCALDLSVVSWTSHFLKNYVCNGQEKTHLGPHKFFEQPPLPHV
jgi:hypothetical protein